MRCPTCHEPLVEESLHGQNVDRCTRCDGLWFDESELGRVVRRVVSPEVAEDAPARGPDGINCPRCRAPMTLAAYAHDSGVLINRCPACSGAWLAAGQLERIAQYRLGTPADRALGDAKASEIRASNLRRRMRDLLRSRLLSAVIAVAYVLAAAFVTDTETTFRLASYLLLPLVCIWFADGMGNRIGVGLGLGQPWITAPTPGNWVAVCGWILMLLPAVAWIIVYG